MRLIIDSNIVFSAILNSESRIGQILINGPQSFIFYTINYLKAEIEDHKDKIIKLKDYNLFSYNSVFDLVTKKIIFVNEELIPEQTVNYSIELVKDIDIDDTYFIALTIYLKAKLWTGDKVLINSLRKKGFKDIITTEELVHLIQKIEFRKE